MLWKLLTRWQSCLFSSPMCCNVRLSCDEPWTLNHLKLLIISCLRKSKEKTQRTSFQRSWQLFKASALNSISTKHWVWLSLGSIGCRKRFVPVSLWDSVWHRPFKKPDTLTYMYLWSFTMKSLVSISNSDEQNSYTRITIASSGETIHKARSHLITRG